MKWSMCLCMVLLPIVFGHISIDVNFNEDWNDGIRYRQILEIKEPILDGYKYKKIFPDVIESLTFQKQIKEEIKSISNFIYLKTLNFQYSYIPNIPTFENIPNLQSLLMMNNNITMITKNTFAGLPLKSIDLGKNFIWHIDKFSFGQEVTHCKLYCNKLTEFNPHWFTNPSGVVWLDLHGNEISSLDGNFIDFDSLDFLYISGNKIATITDKTFNARSLRILMMTSNLIKEFKASYFDSDTNLTILDIGHNRLNYLHDDFFDKVKSSHFILTGNPWSCPCLMEIWNKIGEKTINAHKAMDEPNCVAPQSYQFFCVKHYEEELFEHFTKKYGPPKIEYCSSL